MSNMPNEKSKELDDAIRYMQPSFLGIDLTPACIERACQRIE